MSKSKQGAPGEEPAAAPVASDGATRKRPVEMLPAGDAQPKRRRGSRGGRRHKKPAAAAAASEQVQTKPAAATGQTGQAQGSSPRDGYAAPAGALSDLPTAPLIPAVGPGLPSDR